ncbi:MAG: xanthine dehydrogenase family protein subunit M, partial [Deltaproteobacteria bacterium]
HGDRATVLAGGTDLVPRINYYELKPDVLLYIGALSLDYIKEEEGKLVIGAATPTAKLASDTLVAEKANALAEGAKLSGSVATRNAATIGGNLANASPAADLATPLLAMDAELHLTGAGGKRTVAIKDFFTGSGETVLKSDELLIEIHVPPVKGKTVFLKLGRRKAMTLSVVNVAVHLHMAEKKCNEARIALGAMAPTPMRCLKAEELLRDKALHETLIADCAAKAVAESNPIDDQRATAWYRRKAGAALVARALRQAGGLENEERR